MKKQGHPFFAAFIVFAGALLFAALSSCSRKSLPPATSIEELNDSRRTIGYEEGTASGAVLPPAFPKARLKSFTDKITGYEAVAQGKIDAFSFDRVQMELALKNGLKGVKILGSYGEQVEIAVGISPVTKIPDFKSMIDSFLSDVRADGTLDDMYSRWVDGKSDAMPDIPAAKNTGLHISVGTSGIVPPYSYYKGTELTGYDIELIRRFAAWLGASYEIKVYDYGSIIAAALAGDIDCIFANLNETPERREKIIFSEPIYTEQNALLVRDESSGGAAGSDKSAALETAAGKKDVPPQFVGMTLKYNSIEEMAQNDKLVIGMHTGFVMVEKLTRQMLPKAKIEYYKTNADLAYMTVSGKIDGFINDEPVIRYAALEVPDLGYIHCGIDPMNIVVCFQKNDKGAALRDEFNTYIKKWRADGTLKKIDDLWLSNDEARKVVDLNIAGERGTLRLATDASNPPFDYIKDGKIVGYEIDLIVRFCRAAGYGLDVQNAPFDSLVMGLETGMYDLVADCLTETPAHKESANVSEPVYLSECVMAVKILDRGNGDSAKEKTAASSAKATMPDFNNATLGVYSGTTMDALTRKLYPHAKMEYYNTMPDMAYRLEQGQLDGFLTDEPLARYIQKEFPAVTYIPLKDEPMDYGFVFGKSKKGEPLRRQMNDFLAEIKADGALKEIDSLWFGDDEEKKVIDADGLAATNGTLNFATFALQPPFSYIKNNAIVGYDVDIAARFCRRYGYGIKIINSEFAGLLSGIASGQYDFGANCITITEERAKSINFSAPNYSGSAVMVVKKGGAFDTSGGTAGKSYATNGATARAKASPASSFASSFEKTFVRESRWRLILSGIGVTILISLLSAIFGTILGFGLCAVRLNGNKIANGAALAYIRIMQGTPMVVLLMILFYIVFAKTGLNSVWVAVIGFAMNFGAYVSEMIRTGILAVDKGQTEAALALGYSRPRAFVKIVLPQAARHFLPVFQGEFISLVKMTSVVGYIAIQDLTKASDIIRSRTYEAFFPLVTTAIIYFVIAWLLTRSLSALQNRLDPKRRRAARREQVLFK